MTTQETIKIPLDIDDLRAREKEIFDLFGNGQGTDDLREEYFLIYDAIGEYAAKAIGARQRNH